MKQQNNQSYDQKKGAADRDVTGSKKGVPGGDIGRNSMSSSSTSARSDHGGSEADSRERKSSPGGAKSNES